MAADLYLAAPQGSVVGFAEHSVAVAVIHHGRFNLFVADGYAAGQVGVEYRYRNTDADEETASVLLVIHAPQVFGTHLTQVAYDGDGAGIACRDTVFVRLLGGVELRPVPRHIPFRTGEKDARTESYRAALRVVQQGRQLAGGGVAGVLHLR